jgi:hypothetical protein
VGMCCGRPRYVAEQEREHGEDCNHNALPLGAGACSRAICHAVSEYAARDSGQARRVVLSSHARDGTLCSLQH